MEEPDERAVVPLPVVFKLAEAVPVRYRALVLLATFADMPWGELAGLRRENIDPVACPGVPRHLRVLREDRKKDPIESSRP